MSTLEENKAVVRRAYLEAMNSRNLDIFDEVFSPEYIAHFPGQPSVQGVEPLKTVLQAFFEAFPDIVFSVDDQLAEGNKVATRWSAEGTQEGVWHGFPPRAKGIPATGRHVEFGAIDVYVVEDGKIVEEWNTLEQLAVLEQIGVVDAS